MEFNEDFASIHGYLCADGYVIRNPDTQKHKYYLMGFRNQNSVLLKDFQKRFTRIFGKKARMRKDGRCVANSKEIYYDLTRNWSFYSDDWLLPSILGQHLRMWLRAYFDCEAWVEVQGRKNRRIGLDSINRAGILQIQEVLRSFGIHSIVKKRGNKEIFRMQIFGKQNILNFSKGIGFLHPNKKRKLKELLDSYPNYIWEFPNNRAEQREFAKKMMLRKAKAKKPYCIRVISNKVKNILTLSSLLDDIFRIENRWSERRSGQGTKYYEISINKKQSVSKALKHGLLNKREIIKLGVYE